MRTFENDDPTVSELDGLGEEIVPIDAVLVREELLQNDSVVEATSVQTEDRGKCPSSCEKETQRPMVPIVPYKDQCERRQREFRSDVIDTIKDTALKYVCFEKNDLTEFIRDTVNSKKWSSTFGLSSNCQDVSANPTIRGLVKEYKASADKEKSKETRKRLTNLKGKIYIGSSMKNSRMSLTGENTPDQFKHRTDAANSIGRLTTYGDERRRLLSIIAMDYPYRILQELFGCSPNTVTAAKVHCILFGRGGRPPSKFKFSRQCVSADVLKELSEFFQRDNVSRPSSCRSVVVDGEETPIQYWKDNVKELVKQYLLEFPGGVKRTYVYTHLPPNFRYNTMLAGLCNLCDEFGYLNVEKLTCFLSDVERATTTSVSGLKSKVLEHQRFMKTKFCLHEVAKSVNELLSTIASANEQTRLSEEIKGFMQVHTQYVGHLLQFIMDNL